MHISIRVDLILKNSQDLTSSLNAFKKSVNHFMYLRSQSEFVFFKHIVTWVFGFCFMFMFSCILFWSLVMVPVLSCYSLAPSHPAFGSMVNVSCSHWLVLVM